MKTVGTKDEWLISIQNYVDETTKISQIDRVPSMLREIESNKKCYDPLVVSIGPYHHGKPELQAWEKLKIRFAHQFHRACGDQVSIQELYAEVAKEADRARECYEKGSKTEDYDDESFIRMMFLDGCFVLQYMYYILTRNQINYSMEPKEEGSLLDVKTYQHDFVWRDLFLLENQIPLLVLKVLMKFRFKNIREQTKLIQDFLNLATIMPRQGISCTNKVKKFVDCFNRDQTKDKQELKLDGSPHLLDLMRAQLIGPSTHEEKNLSTSDQWQSYRSVTELKSAGIQFKASKTHCVADVKFKSHLIFCTMMLPPMMVDDFTKPMLLNLVAYEMCPHGPSDLLITSYIWLMDSLIDHADDVKELRKKGIIFNNLGSDDQLAQLFNEIANDLVPDPRVYADAKGRIEKPCKNKCRVEEVASNARECYEEGSTEIYDDESFIRMMFLDGCFVLQFMCILTKTSSMNSVKTETEPKEGDPIFEEMKSHYMAFVWRDLFSLENQIPLLVLKVLMNHRFKRKEQETKLFRDFFSLVGTMPPQETSYINKVMKFVGKCLTSDVTEQNQEMLKFDESPHLLDLIRATLIELSAREDVIRGVQTIGICIVQ
ncbi:Plant protein of unknown function (DUF247) [Abeliophyllum distichum]|uniref:Uncharacterized protein n=1 Tax=Abeliophyllum distichum TaxID=126358 RepID=A0ABD1VCQ4_9LAMI